MKSTMLRAGVFITILSFVAIVLVAPRINAQGTPVASTPASVDPAVIEEGKTIVTAICLACHQPGGAGIEGVYPALAGNPFVTLEDPSVVISTVLNGRGGMPRFASNFSDEQLAAILTYVRTSLGENHAGAVTPEQVAEVRAAGAPAAGGGEEEHPEEIPAGESW
jgi:mono/diheme cytochrome c family protein